MRKRILRDLLWLMLLLGLLALLPAPQAPSAHPASGDWWETTYDACDALNDGDPARAEELYQRAVELSRDQPRYLAPSLEGLAHAKRELGKAAEARALEESAARVRYAHPD